MARPRLTDDERKRRKNERSKQYYQQHAAELRERAREHNTAYYIANKKEINARRSIAFKERQKKWLKLKAIFDDQEEMVKTIIESLEID